jgi:hypothetical protein
LNSGGAPLRGAFPAETAPAWFAVRRGVLRRTSSATLEPRRTGFSPRGQF